MSEPRGRPRIPDPAELASHLRDHLGRVRLLSGPDREWVPAHEAGHPGRLVELWELGHLDAREVVARGGGSLHLYRPAGPWPDVDDLGGCVDCGQPGRWLVAVMAVRRNASHTVHVAARAAEVACGGHLPRICDRLADSETAPPFRWELVVRRYGRPRGRS